MANKVIIDIEARLLDKVSASAKAAAAGLDNIDQKAKKAKKSLGDVGRQKVKPQISVDDNRFIKAIRSAEDRCKKLGRTKTAAILDATDRATTKILKATSKAKAFAGNFMARLGINPGDSMSTLGKITSGIKNITGKVWRGTIAIKDMALAPIRRIYNALFSLKGLMATVAGAYVTRQLIMDPVQTADSIESARIAFETKLGSSKKAEDFLQSIYKFDEKSPFDTLQIVGIAQQMMNTGWNADNVLGDLGTIGDWAASMGKGEEGISAVTRALGQMRQKGKLSSEEMLQLTEAGVSGWDYLARYLGKTIPEVRELAEDGEIEVNTAIKGIIEGMKEFEGAAAATSDRTVTGIIDQVKSLFQTYVKLPWGEGLATGFKDGLGQVRDLLDENKDKFKEWGAYLKEVGTAVSTWLADKVEVTLERIEDIVGSDDFKNATAGEKVGMLWDGVVADPLSEWWNGGGRKAVQDKAVEIGVAIGEGIIKGLGTFIQNHPLAALLLGTGAGLRAAGGGSILAGLFKLGGSIGSASAGAGILGFGANAAIGLGAGNLAGGASLGAGALSMLGLGATAGGLAGGASLISGIADLYGGYKNGDAAKKKSGWWKVGGVGAGAAAGAALGSVIPGLGTAVGGLIGAGVGGIAGWITGSRSADKYTESVKKAAKQTEVMTAEERKLAKENLAKHFGDVTLSADEMESTLRSLIGAKFFEETEAATKAITTMNESFEAFEGQNTALKKNVWMASIKRDAKLTESEVSGLKSSVESFGNSAQTYVKDAQYAATESITSIMGNSDEAKKLIESTNKYYEGQSDELSKLSKQLNEKLSDALSDNVISVKEKESIDKIRSQIANIIRQIQEDEYEAEINILKAKYLGDMTPEGFGDLMKGAADQNAALAEAYWDEFGRASVGKSEEEIETLRQGVLNKLQTLWTNTGELGLGTLQEQYAKELGILGDDIATVLENNTTEQIMSAVESMSGDTRGAISELMGHMKPTVEEAEALASAYKDAGMKVPDALMSFLETAEFYEALSKGPKAVEDYFKDREIDVSTKTNIDVEYEANQFEGRRSQFGIEPSYTMSEISVYVPVKYRVISGGTTAEGNIKMNYASKQAQLFGAGGSRFRGGFVDGYSDGGFVHGGGQLIRVAEEGDSEVVIPLSQRRRDRAMQLWEKTGNILHANFGGNYALGGFTDDTSEGRRSPVKISGADMGGAQTIKIDVGGIELNVRVEGGQDVVAAIQDQKEELADEIAGIIEKALAEQFRNMPRRKGA